MDYLRIRNITEVEFDSIIEAADGKRITREGSADYILKEAIIELKFIKEEGLEKEARRIKIAKLFREEQPNAPVVVIDPASLNPHRAREYYNIVSGPIKTHVKKAASQLEVTAQRYDPRPVRV